MTASFVISFLVNSLLLWLVSCATPRWSFLKLEGAGSLFSSPTFLGVHSNMSD